MVESIVGLYEYIKENYCFQIELRNEKELFVFFQKDFIMTITFCNIYKLYFNNIFYYDVDIQDIIDTINDIFSNTYIFCIVKHKPKNRIKVVSLEKYRDNNNIINAWTIDKKIK